MKQVPFCTSLPHSLAEPPTNWKYCWAILRCSFCTTYIEHSQSQLHQYKHLTLSIADVCIHTLQRLSNHNIWDIITGFYQPSSSHPNFPQNSAFLSDSEFQCQLLSSLQYLVMTKRHIMCYKKLQPFNSAITLSMPSQLWQFWAKICQ